MQSQRHAAAGMAQQLQSFDGCNTHAVFGRFQGEPAPISLDARYLNMAWPIWQSCGCHGVAISLQPISDVSRAVAAHKLLARRGLMCEKCRHILCYRVSWDLKRAATSTAQPIQSKPGPRFAIVAGANAFASLAAGCLTSGCETSALHDNCGRELRGNLLLTLQPI